MSAPTPGTGPGLRRNILSVPNAIALSAASMAPVVAVVLNAPAAAPLAGAALPLSFLVAFVLSLFVGNSVLEFSKRLPSAGSFYTFNRHGLGPAAGFMTGWMYVLGYALFDLGLFTAFGGFAHDYALGTFGANLPWYLFSAIAMVIVLTLSIRSIKTSVQVDLTMLGIEVTVFVVLAIIAIAKGGSGNTLSYFSTASSPQGLSGVGFGVVFAILSFVGFEAAATLGMETKDPRRNIPRAVVSALVVVGIFYVFVMYALAAGYGLNNAAHMQAFLKDANPFITLAHKDAPWLQQIVSLVAMFGIFSCFLAIHNTVVRVLYAMGRDGVLPRWLGHTHEKFHSPSNAIWTVMAFTVLFGVPVALWIGPGATGAYGFTGAIGTVLVVIVYLLCQISIMRYSAQVKDKSVLKHIILPILAILGLAYPLWSTIQPGPFPYNLVPVIDLIWIVAGVVVYLILKGKDPEKIEKMGSDLAE